MIPNHYSARLSALDMRVAHAVPPGGNWKNVPSSVPSKRLDSIRKSFAAGEGSRSTYYGRLHPDRPSYTINTYFNRPGNGCHLHYDYEGGQHRVLSEREAARLQSFPDSFHFLGAHGSVQKQIGNAVPPLLAFQIARSLGPPGEFVDLFSGAGGLSLGFIWAGWRPLVASDIDPTFLQSYSANVHDKVIAGDIRNPSVFSEVSSIAKSARTPGSRLLVLGGPPCQGFSTAGNRRTLEDDRNHLFTEFKRLLHDIRPDGFVFENVTGLLNMKGGAVYQLIKEELRLKGQQLDSMVLRTEEYAIPQRRTRLFLVSLPCELPRSLPEPVTGMASSPSIHGPKPRAVSAREALSDLPTLQAGEDGTQFVYRTQPTNAFQRLMRGVISPREYLAGIRGSGRIVA